MPSMTRNNWNRGWTPNSTDIDGDPNGLLRADNLTLEEDGSLRLIRGTKVASNPLTTAPVNIYSKIISPFTAGYPQFAKMRYVVMGDTVIRNYSPGTKSETIYDHGIITGGGAQGGAFGFGFGHVFIAHGSKLVKDTGIEQSPLGLPAPPKPGTVVNTPPKVLMHASESIYNEFQIWENDIVFDNVSDYVIIDSDPITNRAVTIAGEFTVVSFDGTALDGISGTGTDEDIFSINVRIGDTSKLVKVRIEYLLKAPEAPGFAADLTDYYSIEWSTEERREILLNPVPGDEIAWEDRTAFIENARREFENSYSQVKFTSEFNLGINTWSRLQAKRSDFVRSGTDASLTWANIAGIRVTFVTTEQQTFAFNGMEFIGGVNGPLNGQYTYIQVDACNNNFYVEKSLPSPPSDVENVVKGSIQVSPTTVDANANICMIYRSGGKTNGYYLVKTITGAKGFAPAPFDDIVSDVEALRIGDLLNHNLNNLPDDIIGMECDWKGRNWYISFERVYPSDRNNVSVYDSRHVLETFGNTEYNLFITRLNDDTLILATNKDFYALSGSAGEIEGPNGTTIFDISKRPLGIKSPTISKTFAVKDGNLFYRAADGIRVLSGSTCQLLSNDIDLLFKEARHGLNPTINTPLDNYYIGVSKNYLYYSTAQQTDNKRALYIYSFADQLWRYEEHGDTDSIAALWVEEDDTIIYNTASFGDKRMRELGVGTLFDSANNIPFLLRTTYDCDQLPRNRKDAYTLKVMADSGNTAVTVILRGRRDDNSIVTYTTVQAFNGTTEFQFPVYATLGTVKYFQLEISGTVPVFRLFNFTVDYDKRPTQLTSLRLEPNNYGIAGRKRVPQLPMIIDTLGNNITFTPVVDGVPQVPANINTTDRTVFNYYFTSDVVGYNIGGGLTGGLFEFYELIQPRHIELLPDPLKFKYTNTTNLGTGSRKRFIQFAIVIDTKGATAVLTPIVDGVEQVPQNIITNRKQTVIYTFEYLAVGVDIAGKITGASEFEYYEINLDECVSEKLPPLAKWLHITHTNLGTASRKRVSQFAFVIDTFGLPATFTPVIDGNTYPSQTYTTNRKQTVIYTFANPTVCVDLGGTIGGTGDFEYYGPNLEESVYEKLPPKTQALTIPSTNFGTAGKKRIRTIPLVIDTFGLNVVYTPRVDGVNYPPATFNTSEKTTVLYYFEEIAIAQGLPFGIDYGGTLVGVGDFEFYGLLQPENVETLPVGKKFDQLGPIEFSKVGKIREISIRMVATGVSLSFRVFASDSSVLNGTITTVPNMEKTYVISMPKGINPNIFRLELSSPTVFHRMDAEVKVNLEGSQTANKRIKVK